jgi:hypothetical protein
MCVQINDFRHLSMFFFWNVHTIEIETKSSSITIGSLHVLVNHFIILIFGCTMTLSLSLSYIQNLQPIFLIKEKCAGNGDGIHCFLHVIVMNTEMLHYIPGSYPFIIPTQICITSFRNNLFIDFLVLSSVLLCNPRSMSDFSSIWNLHLI